MVILYEVTHLPSRMRIWGQTISSSSHLARISIGQTLDSSQFDENRSTASSWQLLEQCDMSFSTPTWQFWDSGGVKLESLCNFSTVGCQWTMSAGLGSTIYFYACTLVGSRVCEHRRTQEKAHPDPWFLCWWLPLQ